MTKVRAAFAYAGIATLAGAAVLAMCGTPVVEPEPAPTPSPTVSVDALPPTDDILDPRSFAPVATPEPEPEPTEEPEPEPQPEPTREAVATVPEPGPPPEYKPEVVTLSPITAFESQAAVDTGALVTWFDPGVWGLCLLAGHDNMGWYWLDDLAVGTIVRVTQGPCTGEYEVVGHSWQPVKGGEAPDWMWNYDLILQTCTGNSGTGFSLAVRR